MFRKFKRLLKGNKAKKQQLPAAFLEEFSRLKELEGAAGKRFTLDEADFYPCLDDNTSYTGFDRHYIYHPAWAARILRRVNPEKHIDISSTLHFCSLLSAFIPVDFYDYRPARLELDDLRSLPADLLALPFESNSVRSLSCMHTLEHIGLGRYGDQMDYDGDIKAAAELERVLAPGGHLLMVVPVGHESRIFFNAHRIYTKQQALGLFPGLTLKEFALIPEDEEDGGLVTDPGETLLSKQVYGCGCFYFTK
ncbi:uncharacterized protein DUF268 [Anseongella ginsenosidimutans]|uniref:Uncharacterized protein DUF268 n=1 Tax=Anseongella ginsenosidimutans TaxID=496056 RepID=A0A4R3KNH5_9SPHI|nr:DUF268 domain-containing protein [Anseongella ginsenosidimutans]QEC51989.1 DUF268 domain-containing protein [Anseongella ginsenosidimutans]TCS85714.1 uncharacterized protein DUF268 [Anseongella ginsenosidimutans]